MARLPVYQRILGELLRSGTTTVSSELLASAARVNAAKVRKDLSLLGSFGTRGAGYDTAFLIEQIDRQLGLDRVWPVVIAGIGNLGRALARSQGFAARNFRVAALFDTDPAIIGEVVDGVLVRHPDELPTVAAEVPLAIGVITTPASVAQRVADTMVGRRRAVDPQLRAPGHRGAARSPAPLRRPEHRAPGDELLPVPPRGQYGRPLHAGYPVHRCLHPLGPLSGYVPSPGKPHRRAVEVRRGQGRPRVAVAFTGGDAGGPGCSCRNPGGTALALWGGPVRHHDPRARL